MRASPAEPRNLLFVLAGNLSKLGSIHRRRITNDPPENPREIGWILKTDFIAYRRYIRAFILQELLSLLNSKFQQVLLKCLMSFFLKNAPKVKIGHTAFFRHIHSTYFLSIFLLI